MIRFLYILLALCVSSLSLTREHDYHLKNKRHATKKYQTQQEKKRKFKEVNCVYINEMEIGSPAYDIDAYQTSYYTTQKAHIDALSKKYRRDVKNHVLAPMYLKWISPQVGCGIFAARALKKGEFIGTYAGTLRPLRVHDDKETLDYAWFYSVDTVDGKRMVIDGEFRGNELRFINHSNKPNCSIIEIVVDGRFYLCYIADKNIAKDIQLTVDYGDGYWTSRGVDPEKIK